MAASTLFLCFVACALAPLSVDAAHWKLKRSQKTKAWNDPFCASTGTCHFLLYFSGSQFCSSDNVQCLEVTPDDMCHMTGSFHTKMSSSGPPYTLISGPDDCTCYNGVAGPVSKPADGNEGVSGFSSSCDDGVKLVTGTWCERSSMDPSYACATGGEFTENIKAMCGGNYDFDVLGARMCNKVGFHLQDRKVLKHERAGAGERKVLKHERAGAGRSGFAVVPFMLAFAVFVAR